MFSSFCATRTVSDVTLRPGIVAATVVVLAFIMSAEAVQATSVPGRPASVTLDACSLFHVWNYAIKQQRTTPGAIESPVRTLLSPEHYLMMNLVPQDGPHPFYSSQFTDLRRQFLLDHMLAESVDPDDPRMTSPGGLPASTLADSDVVFRRESQGKITVNDRPVQAVDKLSDGTVLYTLQDVLFDYEQQIREAFEKLLEEEASNNPVGFPPF
ncbi:uncharacterized protein LOC122262824 [Penaeus japonicus]|uniref:uncharacterized protein LOC122258984 n=1 Tax=Penaeus japonicus TaxID=27405 RepID=UPI001C70BD3F|nr:uncharacterized protein LOC122258984 [Penaeus japonicus]XP_042886924.1 uncharacterized protein LOC122262824 [Penaeus japonicus]